ncbi:MFS transporter [Arthrobacter sp. LAPM80]|uniref:MFS transporter n=1 Tax=Arthrobacter sp. LAPM80 TaxID=3141788 RepID=UPI00398BA123
MSSSTRNAADRLSARDRTTNTALLVSTFAVILNETIINVALPRRMEQFQVSPPAIQRLATAFMLTMSVVIPATGYLLTRFPLRTVFILAMGLFSAGTLLAGLAPGVEVLLMACVVQASGTAIMMPLVMITILDLVPSHRRGTCAGHASTSPWQQTQPFQAQHSLRADLHSRVRWPCAGRHRRPAVNPKRK